MSGFYWTITRKTSHILDCGSHFRQPLWHVDDSPEILSSTAAPMPMVQWRVSLVRKLPYCKGNGNAAPHATLAFSFLDLRKWLSVCSNQKVQPKKKWAWDSQIPSLYHLSTSFILVSHHGIRMNSTLFFDHLSAPNGPSFRGRSKPDFWPWILILFGGWNIWKSMTKCVVLLNLPKFPWLAMLASCCVCKWVECNLHASSPSSRIVNTPTHLVPWLPSSTLAHAEAPLQVCRSATRPENIHVH